MSSAGTTGPVRVVLTFRNQQGEFCRSFEGKAASGVACRLGRDWRIAGFYPGDQTQHGDYRTAAAGDPRIMALVEDMIEGAPLDSSEERNARDSGWKAGLSLPAPG